MVQVRVSEGVLEGELVQNEYGGEFCSFKGIPYAQPPLGDLRFRAPQPPKSWEGVRSAKELGSPCFQVSLMTKENMGSEDCLYLNIYTPDVTPKEPLPVMVWIHGGGFVAGAGDIEGFSGPEFLVRQGVILVTINYRLEVLGFLCLDTEDAPGNAGMKDQVEALRWVKKNIAQFGGNPKNVTIFGESAGGASVSFHLISPMSKGLFKRAIAQSGSASCHWTQVYQPRERAFALGRKLGMYTDDVQELYKFLKAAPVESLVNARVPILLSEKVSEDMNLFFNIVNEKQFGTQERFFYGDVLESFKLGVHAGVDVMTGYTSEEGVMDIGTPERLDKKIHLANNYLDYFVPKPFAIALPIEQQLEVSHKIRKYYVNNKELTADDWELLASFYGMSMFIYWIIQTAKLCVHKGKRNFYLYKFTCKSERNMIAHLMGSGPIIKDKVVTGHADDLFYLFNASIIPVKLEVGSKTFEMIDRVTKLWTNFAKYGNPTPDDTLGVTWQPYSLEKEDYLEIGNVLEAKTRPDSDEVEWWENLYKQYGLQSELKY